ncbi:MAG: (Fe-S)-binding protein [Peptococcales bacterium]|jgi:glycolate oxidase iron-sulfur subunit
MKKEELLEILLNCNRCGTCQETCPTYKVSHLESNVARGRNRLIRLALENQLNLDMEPEVEKFINECLLCKACEVNCPSGVPTPEIITSIRNYYTKTKGLPLTKKILYRGVFSKNQNISIVRNLVWLYQKTGINKLVKFTGLMNKTDEMLPDLPAKNVRAQLPQLLRKIANPEHKVAYFLGCSVNNFFSSIGIASIKVLQENNCQVLVPDVNCCGAPHHSAGDLEEFKRLAKINLEKLDALDVETILFDCSTCASIIKEYQQLFKDDAKYSQIAVQIANKVEDISSFLVRTGFKKPQKTISAKVTYHDPCHGIRYLKVKDAPREILKSIPGIKLTEMQEADMCCGGAGSYGIFNPKLSRDILMRKMDNYQKTQATILATSCPACTMQLAFGMKIHNVNGSVKHPMELLAQAYELKS